MVGMGCVRVCFFATADDQDCERYVHSHPLMNWVKNQQKTQNFDQELCAVKRSEQFSSAKRVFIKLLDQN